MIEWFLRVVDVDSMSGAVRGVREWPYGDGRMTKQPARLVAAVDVLTAELAFIQSDRQKRQDERKAAAAKMGSRSLPGASLDGVITPARPN